jgi:ribosome-binding ATPase YchF (GTP1/OBG family)
MNYLSKWIEETIINNPDVITPEDTIEMIYKELHYFFDEDLPDAIDNLVKEVKIEKKKKR